MGLEENAGEAIDKQENEDGQEPVAGELPSSLTLRLWIGLKGGQFAGDGLAALRTIGRAIGDFFPASRAIDQRHLFRAASHPNLHQLMLA